MECAFFPPPPSVEEPDDVPILASSENAQNMLWGVVVEADTLVAFKRIVDGRRWPQNAAVTQQVRQHVWKKWIKFGSGTFFRNVTYPRSEERLLDLLCYSSIFC